MPTNTIEFSKRSQPLIKFSLLKGFQPLKWTISLLLTLTFLGCQTAPKDYSKSSSGHWKMKAMVKTKGKTQLFNLDIKAIEGGPIRMDVLSTLGTHEASIYIGKNSLQAMTLRNKSYYKGRPSSKSLYRLTRIPLDPALLQNLLFDKAIEQKDWICSKKENIVEKCKSPRTRETLEWKNRRGTKKLMVFKSPYGLLQMNVTSYKGEIEAQKIQKLSPPKGFKKLTL